MSVHVSSWVWKHSKPETQAELLFLIALADIANDAGICWPSVKTLSEKCMCTPRTIQNCIERSVARGVLEIERRFQANGHPTTNLYRFTAFQKEFEKFKKEMMGDGESNSPIGESRFRGMVNGDSPPLYQIEPSSEPKRESLCDKAKPASEEQVINYCMDLDLPASDGRYMWAHWEANGFINSGKPIRDWQAVIRSWKAGGYLPSQKNGYKPEPAKKPVTFKPGPTPQWT